MQPQEKNKFGRSDLEVSAFGFGTAPVGNIFEEIDEKTSDEMFQVAWDSGVRFYYTAPMYGHGLSEYRTGYSLRWKNRSDFVLSSKVGRLLHPARKEDINYAPWTNAGRFEVEFNYSYDATMRSVDDSLQRMGLESIDILYIHDIDKFTRGDEQPEVFETAMNGAWRALSKLRDERVVKAIGVGVNEWEVCQDALEQRDFDCFLLAGRYTLLEQEALDTFLPLCEQRNASVVVGGGFNSGILATGAKDGAKYNYSPAPETIKRRVQAIESVCKEFQVPLPAAALQFVVAHPAVPTFMAGTRTVKQLKQNIAWFSHPIPSEFWTALKSKRLIREDAPTP
ncbi:MAG: aldo/keto reductase [Pseudomonadota bacterium]|nr:aldo/keto reductase [Pseudomonadota bacterium]